MCGFPLRLIQTAKLLAALVAGVLLGASTSPQLRAEDAHSCHPETWAAAIEKIERHDAKEPHAPGGIVFTGSSSIRIWDLKKSFPDLPAVNHGFGGSHLCDVAHYVEPLVIKLKPRLVVLYAGDNDIGSGKKPEQVEKDFRDFVEKMHKALPETRIIYISIKPSIARWKFADAMRETNKLIAADCEKDKLLEFLDVWPVMLGKDGNPRPELFRDDKLHMNDAGYEEWTKLLNPKLAEKPAAAKGGQESK
jgi:lysophospholipase L1-like esterase